MTNDMQIIGYGISRNYYTLGMQLVDALKWLENEEPAWYLRLVQDLTPIRRIKLTGLSDIDYAGTGVFPHWQFVLKEAIEMTGKIYWSEGQPYATMTVPVIANA